MNETFAAGYIQTGSSEINHHSPTQGCWNVSSLDLASIRFPMQRLLAVTPYPQTPVSPRNGDNSTTPGQNIPL